MDGMIDLFESITLLGIVKWLLIVFLLVYGLFAYLIMRQTRVMGRAVSMRDDYVIRVVAIAHFAFAVLVLLLSILVL